MKVTPTLKSERIISLDILRGFAILGILIMNIQSMSMIESAYLNPLSYSDFTGINKVVWIFSHIFFDSKFISIFSILFGAGIVLFTDRLKQKGINSLKIHYSRTFWLLLVGLLHAYMLWYGDILVSYALCGLWVVLFRKKKPKTLFIIAFIFITISFLTNFLTGLTVPYMPEEVKQDLMQSWMPTADEIAKELSIYRGSFTKQLSLRIETAIWFQTFLFFFSVGWKITGLMLIGMGLHKSGVLTAQKSKKFYAIFTISGLAIGFLVVIYGMYKNLVNNFSLEYSFFIGSQFNSWGSIFVALGYIGLVMLLIKTFKKGWLAASLQAVGQTALSNYLIQSIIGTLLFYGHGLGLYGKVERWQQMLIVFGVWIIQLIISPIWLKYFKYGPFEWLWRSLTYWERQPMRIKK